LHVHKNRPNEPADNSIVQHLRIEVTTPDFRIPSFPKFQAITLQRKAVKPVMGGVSTTRLMIAANSIPIKLFFYVNS
jgi:hypothetical protein